MEIDTVLIKMEPDVGLICEDDSNDFGCKSTQEHVETDINPQLEYSVTNSNNEGISVNTTRFHGKSELLDSCNNEKSDLKSPVLDMNEDVFDEEDLVDLAKLQKTLKKTKSKSKHSKIKCKDKKFNSCRKKPQVVQEISKNSNAGENIDTSEFLLQSMDTENLGEEQGQKPEFLLQQMDTENVSEEQGTPAIECHFLLQQETEQLPSNQTSQKRFNCNFCCKSFSFKYTLDEHLLKYHSDEIKDNMDDYITSKTHSCEYCNFKTTRKNNLRIHFEALHNIQRKKTNCQFCDKSFSFKYSLDEHLLKYHNEEIKDDIDTFITSKTHSCDYCNFITTRKDNLKVHFYALHNAQRKKINCHFCYKSFSFKYSLDEHLLKYHTEEIKDNIEAFITSKTHSCEYCSFKTTRKDNLKVHFDALHNKERKKINCQFCERTFLLDKTLDDHILKHHRDKTDSVKSKTHKCTTCSYQTTCKSLLDSHVRSVHKEQRSQLNCIFCSKTFSFKTSLGDHMLKQHKQEVNGDITGLITTRIHTCDICSYQSTLKQSLDKHMEAVHNIQSTKVNCKFCDKSFGLKKSLDGHVAKYHKDKINIKKKTYKSHLDKNKDSMHNEKKVKVSCEFCSKSFASKPSLDYHLLKKHEAEMIESDKTDLVTSKIHMCKFCIFKTTIRSDLDGHIKTKHKTEKIKN